MSVVIDLGRQHVTVEGIKIPLTYREFKLLRYLILRSDRTVSRDELIEAQMTWAAIGNPRTIDVHIGRLRGKLGAYAEILRTERGLGYRYDEHPDVRIIAD